MKRRLLSAFLALVTVLMLLPATVIPASAATVVVDTAEKLRAALHEDGDVNIILTADITGYKLPNDFKWDGYDESTDFFYWVTVGQGKKTLNLQGHKVAIDDDFVTTAKYKKESQYNTETGKTTEKEVLVKGLYVQNAAMIRIPTGADLTIYGFGGGFTMTAQMPSYNQIYDNRIVMQRDIFVVRGGNLTVQGGTYQAGRRKDIWVTNAYCYTENWGWELLHGSMTGEDIKAYTGYGEYTINGRAIRIYSGKAAINGGTFKGHGFGYTGSENTTAMTVYRNSVISAYGGELSIRDAKVIGYSGADVLYKRDTAKVEIYSGEFSTQAPDRLLWPNTHTSGIFGWAGYNSNYRAVDVKPGSASIAGAELVNRSATTSYDHKTVVTPASTGFVGGKIMWSDGSTGEIKYTIGAGMTVKFEEPDTYFPRNTIDGGQEYKYYWSLMVKKTDGNWTSVGNGWIEGGKTINLSAVNDNWAEGRNYRLTARRVESWTSEVHSYEQTMKASNTLYFTAKNDKVITSVTVDGFSQSLMSVGPYTLSSSTTGVKSVSSVWHENGNAHTETIEVKSGTYQAYITLTAADGYVFSADTAVNVYGLVVTPNYISSDGKTIHALSPVINKVCDHSGSKSDWTYDTEYHYKYCSVCGKTYQVGKHTYGQSVSSGNLKTYTCTVCGYERTVQNNKEAISAVLLDMPPLIVGNTLTSPKIADDFAGKATLASYQWYKGRGTSEKVSVGTKAESGWYTLEVKLNAKSGYYFKNNAFVSHAHGTKAGASATDGTLTGTVYVYCSEKADLSIKIPQLSPDKTLEDVIKSISASRSGDERINVNYYISVDGNKYMVKRSFNGTYSLFGGAATLEQLFGTKIVPNAIYEIEVEASTGSYYIAPESVSLDSKSFLIGYTSESNDAWASAKATVISDTDVISIVEIYGVKAPAVGATPSDDYNLYDSERIKGIAASWNTLGAFRCGPEYVFTLMVKAVDGYRFDDKTAATVNGVEANIAVKGSSAAISFTFPPVEHDLGGWETVKESTCTEEGISERTCKICGEKETAAIAADGHSFYEIDGTASKCHTHGTKAHLGCRNCAKIFDLGKNVISQSSVELPLDPDKHEGGATVCDENEHYTLCVCGKKLNAGAHTFGEWAVEKEAEPGVAGYKKRECTECGYIDTEELAALPGVHTHSFTIKYDQTNHWNECNCGETEGKEAHVFGNDDVCDICGYKKTGDGPAITTEIEGTETTPAGDSGSGGIGSLIWAWIIAEVVIIGGAVTAIALIVSKKKKEK